MQRKLSGILGMANRGLRFTTLYTAPSSRSAGSEQRRCNRNRSFNHSLPHCWYGSENIAMIVSICLFSVSNSDRGIYIAFPLLVDRRPGGK